MASESGEPSDGEALKMMRGCGGYGGKGEKKNSTYEPMNSEG
jgi:hypothetical protein